MLVFLKKEIKETGSFIKSLDKEAEWTFQINKGVYAVTFCYSEVDNWKTLKINNLLMLKWKMPRESINHAFLIENIDFLLRYDKEKKTFLLLIQGNPIETYTAQNQFQLNLKQMEFQQEQQKIFNQLYGQNKVGSQDKVVDQQSQKQQQIYSITLLEQKIDRSLVIMEQLVELFKGVIDNCQSNEDVINSEDLKKLKQNILVDQGKLTNVLNHEICEASTDKVLKMIDKQVQVSRTKIIATNRFDDICSRKIILAKNQQSSRQDSIKNKIEQYQQKKKNAPIQDDDILILQSDSDSDHYDDEVEEDKNIKADSKQKQSFQSAQNQGFKNEQVLGQRQLQLKQPQPQQQQQQNKGYGYPVQPESQILYYKQKSEQLQQEQKNKVEFENKKAELNQQQQQAKDQQKKEDNLCIICMDQPSTYTLVPCGHKKYCQECAELMVNNKQCAFCRNPAEQCLRIFE